MIDVFILILQHHSYRSFMGFCCLMQISTREEDFIVDTIDLREDLQVLNEVFTNPSILKVCDYISSFKECHFYLG